MQGHPWRHHISPRTILLLATLACGTPTAAPDGTGADTFPAFGDVPRCAGFDDPCDALEPPQRVPSCGKRLFEAPFDAAPPWPATLSELGCLAPGDPWTPAAGVVPFQVNAPLWSQGSRKARFLSVPADAPITATAEGPWTFADGSVVLKVFGLDVYDGDVPEPRAVEIRVMARAQGVWHFATYRWEPDLGDARRVGPAGRFESLDVDVKGARTPLTWWYPRDDGCGSCHGLGAAEVLGPTTRQLDLDRDYGHVIANQLVALATSGWLAGPPPADTLPALPNPARTQDPTEAARSWLHANCAHCHHPGGYAPPEMTLDLRYDLSLADTKACDTRRTSSFPVPGDRLIVPGDAERSHLVQRLLAPEPWKMPPDGATLDDVAGIARVVRWIDDLDGCGGR